jgi:hypothetical protein
MDAFARRVGFEPRRLPPWLTARTHADQGQPGSCADPPVPRFGFDWSRLLPTLTMYQHQSAADLAAGRDGVVRWEGEGPVTHGFVHQHLRPLHGYDLRPVIDLAHQAPADAYELPDRLREAVRLRTPADAFPYSSNTSHRLDADHTTPWTREGQGSTRTGNLAPLARFAHRIKTHGRWVLRQPFEGILLWRDPHGQVYLVDHTGTRPVTQPGHAAGSATGHDPDIEIYPTDTVIEADFGHTG